MKNFHIVMRRNTGIVDGDATLAVDVAAENLHSAIRYAERNNIGYEIQSILVPAGSVIF